jgi:hypothetical protein
MYGLDENVYGRCIPFPGDDYLCAGLFGSRQGVRKFRCLTRFTAHDITSTWGSRLMQAQLNRENGSNKTEEAESV